MRQGKSKQRQRTIASLGLLPFLLIFFFTAQNASALSVSVASGVTPPSWLSSVSCQGSWDSYDWTHQTNSREYPKNNSSVCSGKDPNNPGSCNFYSWPMLWSTPQAQEGCVKTWCDNTNVYAQESWNEGYADGTANTNYSLYLEDTTSHATQTVKGLGSSRSVVLNFGSKSNAGENIFEQVINGWNEWGSPGTGFSLACTSAPVTQPVTPPATQAPTQAPTQGPTQPPAPPTVSLSVVLGLPGIGYNGNAPIHTKRTATIELYDPSVANPGGPGTTPLASQTMTLQYQTTGNSAGYFAAQSQTLTLPANPPTGNTYQILVKVPQYLYKLELTGSNGSNATTFTLAPSTSVTLPILYMDPGDLVTANGGANLLNLDDYTQLKTCFGSSPSCPTTTDGVPVADLNDDGSINIIDFNIMLRSLANFINNESSHCNGLECQGD